MAKKDTVFVCRECGYESPKWLGQCICGAWNSFVEMKIPKEGEAKKGKRPAQPVFAEPLCQVGSKAYGRIDTGIAEFNRVLGGGLVPGSLLLLSGEPGIGKSTLLLQTANRIAAEVGTTLYVSGEESVEQIKMRAERICPNLSPDLLAVSETNMEAILHLAESRGIRFLIIDSIQTMFSEEADAAPGSVSQVRFCGHLLMNLAKTTRIPVLISCHVTKSGELAGPKTVEHMVDTVFSFTGERDRDLRILRSYKNRFGTTSEIGAFRMTKTGLTEIEDLSSTFIEDKENKAEGSVISAIYEGSRPVLLEIQALTSKANPGFARRSTVGIDAKRLAMILAVLERRAGLYLADQDVYVNVVGGIKADSTSVDLATALAVWSSRRGVRTDDRVLILGEVGLTGEIRSVPYAERIAAEAARLQYDRLILPAYNAARLGQEGKSGRMEVQAVRNIREAVQAFSPRNRRPASS